MKKKVINTVVKILFGIMTVLFLNPVTAHASTGSVVFGSESYEYENNTVFPIGVYIEGEETIGTYHVKISYDTNRMKYLEGAERQEEGVLILEGTATGTEVQYMLRFEALSGGTAFIRVEDAKIMTADSNNTSEFEVEDKKEAPIQIAGEDTVGNEVEETTPDKETVEIPTIGSAITLDDSVYYLVDLSQYEMKDQEWKYEYVKGTIEGNEVVFLTNQEKNAKFIYLVDNTENFYLYGYCEENGNLYSCEMIQDGEQTYYLTNAKVCMNWPQNLTLDIVNSEAIYFGINEQGQSGFYFVEDGHVLREWDASLHENSYMEQLRVYKWIGIAVVAVILVMAGLSLLRMLVNRRNHKKSEENYEGIIIYYSDDFPDREENEETGEELSGQSDEQPGDQEVATVVTEKPVISVRNVTMNFRVSTSNASGIKEFLIQLVKKQINFREFKALDNVSFDVMRGEVVGIIGTNGSGKSTILRIVSGALKPSSGYVDVDTRKIQLLTLGTGFDMELTARENVYLNGAIIGLSEKFLDEHYQEIVEFAELEGFMEEKVKNFSSGMVSRLGFAIATVGEVAEILILDEVLSVGDEFFRKKSLAKVKEMIHSGATVLMVSHSAQTIIENCTKTVWIEKGKLMMVGEPKVVCEAYRKSQEK